MNVYNIYSKNIYDDSKYEIKNYVFIEKKS